MKSLFGGLIQQILEAEMEEYLGYLKYDYSNKNTTDSRNWENEKTVKFDLDIPRDREGSFEPQIEKKHQTTRKFNNMGEVCERHVYTRYSYSS
nr:transposase [Clostridium perfringens]